MNWEVFTKLSILPVQAHWLTATVAFFLGVLILARKKGTSSHRFWGRIYVAVMIMTSVSAFFIREGGNKSSGSLTDGFSYIHLFIPFTLTLLLLAILAIKKGNVRGHMFCMGLTFIGGLVIAGAFTFLPDRNMHLFFFGEADAIQQEIERRQTK
ncbi:MAG: DUF2306 domain-containing protein [Granulosicoccus sp.]|nr:DUF2306 domain-containing protein [Granulosicoccus sp.]